MYRSFEEMREARLPKSRGKKRAVVAGANDEHVLEAVFAGQDMGYIFPVLLGPKEAVWKILTDLGLAPGTLLWWTFLRKKTPLPGRCAASGRERGTLSSRGRWRRETCSGPCFPRKPA